MNKSPKSFFRKIIFTWIFLLIAALSGCSEKNQDAFPLPPVDNSPAINNLLTPDRPIWVPYYQLPSDWQINLDNPENARSNYGQGLPAELKVFYLGAADQNPQISTLRDQYYQQVYCQEESAQNAINCAKGFTRTSESIDGFQAEILRYYGTWQDDSREVHEIFVNLNGQILHLTAEGDFQKILPALESLLQTIQWKQEKPSSGPAKEPEEMGL